MMTDTSRDDTDDRQAVRVVCTECSYRKIIDKSQENPADVIVTHGRATGHTLSISPVEEERPRHGP